MKVNVEMRVKVRQVSRGGIIVSETPWQKNLVMDNGLNALARSTNATYPAAMFAACRVGSGSTSDKTSSGAVTFTQSGTTLTASAPFFTLQMVGQLFKWGTGSSGAETYITSFTDSQNVTVADSATVAIPEVGTVWNVVRTTLENLLYSSNTYETSSGACFTSSSNNQITFQRTYNFAQQVAPYNVNEVGYFSSLSGSTIFGRLVLSSTEVVNPTNFLQVVLQLVVTYSPGSPTAVPDVGTNIDTTGAAMFETFVLPGGTSVDNIGRVNSNGTLTPANAWYSIDGSATSGISGIISNYTQNGTTSNSAPSATLFNFQTALNWTYSGARGRMTLACNNTVTTSGQTLYGVCISSNFYPSFDVKFNTPYVLPNGSFLPQVQFAVTYGRTLTN